MQGMTKQESLSRIVAVSGGIDSVVLLHMLALERTGPLVVAHVDHGIRGDSAADARFVADLTRRYGLEFRSVELGLGREASEDAARTARYAWLESIREEYKASSIITAHHEDDVFETMIINLIRGTGWRGIASLRDTQTRQRPLIAWSKAEVIAYALDHELSWREDCTNESLRYLRNRVRSSVIPRLNGEQRATFRRLYGSQLLLRDDIETEVQGLLAAICSEGLLLRYPIVMMPDAVAQEVLAGWLGESLEQGRLRDLLLFAKTARSGAKWSLDSRRYVVMTPQGLIVSSSRD